MLGTQQPVRRSWPQTLGYLLLAALVAAGGTIALVLAAVFQAALFELGCVVYLLIALLILGGVAVPYAVFAVGRRAICRSSWAPCPRCGTPISGLSSGKNDPVACPACPIYVAGDRGKIAEAEEDAVSSEPVFRSPLPEGAVMPDSCCVCGRPATGRQKLKLVDTAHRDPSGTKPSTVLAEVQAPHCRDHPSAARLESVGGAPFIVFRSYRYLQAFRDANGIKSGQDVDDSGQLHRQDMRSKT